MKLRPIYSAARLSLPLATALVALFNLTAQRASAIDLYWDTNGASPGSGPATGTWGTDPFWSTDVTGSSATANTTTTGVDDLFFSAGAGGPGGIVTVNLSQTARTLTFVDGAITLSGGTVTTLGITNSGTGLLTFSNAVTSGANTTELVVNTANNDIRFDGIFTGTLTKTGSGTMTLGGTPAHSIGGIITVNQGLLITGRAGTDLLPAATINSGGTLRWGTSGEFANGSSFTINAGGTLDLNAQTDLVGGITGSGLVTNTSGSNALLQLQGTQTFDGLITGPIALQIRTGGDQTLSGLNTYSRTTTIGSGGTPGTLRINSIANANAGGGGGASAIGTPSSVANGIISMGDGVANGTLIYTGTGHTTNRQIRIGTNSTTPVAGDTGGAVIQADGASNAALIFSATNSQTNATTGVGADRTLTLQGASTGDNTFSGIIRNNLATSGTATVGVTKAQAGTWVLSGVNTYTGATTITGGILKLGANNCLPDTSAVSIAAASLDVGTFKDTAGTLDVTAAATITVGSGGTLDFADSSGVDWTGGTLNIIGTFAPGSYIRFGTSAATLTPTQLGLISINGTPGASLDSMGYLVGSPAAPPAALTWSGGNGNWTAGSAGGWSANWGVADTGTFTGSGGIVTLTTAITVGDAASSLAFNGTGDYSLIAGSALTLTLSPIAPNTAITVAASRTATVGGNVTLTTTASNQNNVFSGAGLTSKLVIENGTIKGNGANNTNILSLNDITVEVKSGGTLTATLIGANLGQPSGTALFVNGNLDVLGGTVTSFGTFGLGQATGTLAGNLTLTSGSFSAVSANGIRFGGNSGTTAGGTLHLDGGILSAFRIQKGTGIVTTSVLNLNGGLLKATATADGSNATTAPNFIEGLGRANVRNGGAKIDSAGFNLVVTQDLLHSGNVLDLATDGGLTKSGLGTLTLSGANTYTGDTTVSGGTLTLGQINASNEASTVSIASAAVLDLTFGGTDTVDKLFLNGVQQPIGVYGSGNSGGRITGTGTLTVSSGPVGGFSSWITGFGLAPADQDPTDDPENDGMNNLLEFVLNGNPSLSDTSILPKLVVTSTDFEFTYQRRDDSVSPETTQTFQWGTTLATWPGSAVIPATSATVGVATITVSPGIPNDAVTGTVKISIPKTEAAGGKLFGRLKAVK